MGDLSLVRLTSTESLREAASRWDDVWWRSEVTTPACRAELVAQWVDRFTPAAGFCGLVVADGGRWLAALPLVPPPRAMVLCPAEAPSNSWCVCGDLLLDAEADPQPVLEAMLGGLRATGWPLVWLREVRLGTPRWRAFHQAAVRAGMSIDLHEHTRVGVIAIPHDLEAFERGLPKKHRTKMARCLRRIAERGEARLEFCPQTDAAAIEATLRTAFAVEDRSWKGEAGSSVLRSPGMLEYYIEQAQRLARWGQLDLATLYCGETPVSFVYGFTAKGVSHWQKIGYDADFACCTPGQLLQWQLLERLQSRPDCLTVDTMGPLTESLSRWRPAPVAVGRIALAPGPVSGRLFLGAWTHCGPVVARWRKPENGRPTPDRQCCRNAEARNGDDMTDPLWCAARR